MPFLRHFLLKILDQTYPSLIKHICPSMPLFIILFSSGTFSLLNTSLFAAQVPSQLSVSADYLFLKHATYNPYGNTLSTEQSWIPGTQLVFSNASKRLSSRFSLALYSGNINYTTETTGEKTNINEDLMRMSYRFDYALPDRMFHFYGLAMFQNWGREASTIGLIRQYQWFSFEGGIQFDLFTSRAKENNIRADIGFFRIIGTKVLSDLTAINFGKPLLYPQNRFGGTLSLVFEHLFNRTQGLNFYMQSTYWQFGASPSRTIGNSTESAVIAIRESQTLTSTLGIAYFHRF